MVYTFTTTKFVFNMAPGDTYWWAAGRWAEARRGSQEAGPGADAPARPCRRAARPSCRPARSR
jgi:hypothetical protein